MAKPFVKPSHKGLLHKQLGVPQGQKIGMSRLESAAHSSNPVERKRAQYAINMQGGDNHDKAYAKMCKAGRCKGSM